MKINEFCSDKQLSQSTCNFYQSAVRMYEEVTGLSLDELLIEADKEEFERVPWKYRKIREHLLNFRNYLFANRSEGTAKRYFAGIKTIYTHFEVELHSLPSFNSKQIDKTYKMDYEDLLTIDEIIDGYYEANNTIKQIIVFGISTGLSKVDMLNMFVDDFVENCLEYIESIGIQVNRDMNLLDKLFLIKEVSKDNPIIPCFRAERQKTSSKYITFCSPEAVEHIVQGLIGRDATIREKYQEAEDKENLPDKLYESDKLFAVTPEHVGYVFRKINAKLGLGKVGKFAKFRCHMLRKFHASTLLNSEIITWTVEEIDTLQGRSMDITHQAYFKNSREKLFKKYYECVDELMLFNQIHTIDEEEVEKLKQENNFFKKEIVKNESKMEEQQKRIDEIIRNQRELEALLGL
jgi:integrase